MDWLKMAEIALSDAHREAQKREGNLRVKLPGDPVLDPNESIGYAIAAALLALAERKPRFVQVGNKTIRVDDIVQINRTSTMVEVFYFGGDSAAFFGKNADLFEAWWADNAGVTQAGVANTDGDVPCLTTT